MCNTLSHHACSHSFLITANLILRLKMCSSYAWLILLSVLSICHGNNLVFLFQLISSESLFETGQCTFHGISLKIENGRISNFMNILITAGNLISGYVEYSCDFGYTLNPSIGNRLTCYSNGSWSALPECKCKLIGSVYEGNKMCLASDPCPTEPLFNFLLSQSTLITMTFDGNHSLGGNGTVMSGTSVPMKCRDGRVNAAGSLDIRCINGSWTRFPSCVPHRNGGHIDIGYNIGSPCPIDSASFHTEHGRATDVSSFFFPHYMDTTFDGM